MLFYGARLNYSNAKSFSIIPEKYFSMIAELTNDPLDYEKKLLKNKKRKILSLSKLRRPVSLILAVPSP